MGLHKNLRFSLLAFAADFVTKVTDLTTNMVAVDFDAPEYADLTKFPEKDLIGIKDFSWRDDGGLAVVTVMFGISTFGDLNAFRHTDLMDRLTALLLPERKITVVDGAGDGSTVLGWMVVSGGMEVLPVIPSPIRSVQLVSLDLLTDQSTR